MKALLITVAGTSSRFSASLGREQLKCLYCENDFRQSLLYKTVKRDGSFDRYVIVGGYKFDELETAVKTYFAGIADKTDLLFNEHYADYASGYSLFVGLKHLIDLGADEIVFAEGDLWVDEPSFKRVSMSDMDAVTFTRETIDAVKSVVFYLDTERTVHYLYDTAHGSLEIKEPFSRIYNSGQIWKFIGTEKIKKSFLSLSESDWQGTNLVFIQRYFGGRSFRDYETIELKKWLNCNTVDDYLKIKEFENENAR